MNQTKKGLFLIAGVGVLALAGCGGTTSNATYTYNTYLSTSPKNWNVHNWQSSDESYITSFTEMGLYDCILNSAKDGYEFVSEMASDFPTSIDPTDLTDDELKYFKGNPSTGMVWDIPLNKSACWEDGTAIKAVDYVDSMERQLSPKYANFRADSYYHQNLVIANAENYFKNGRQTIEDAYSYVVAGNGEIEYDTGYWFINLGVTSALAASVFSNADADTTFYTLLNNRSTKGSDAMELAARRITIGVSYYLWKFMDHTGASDATSWDELGRPSAVTDTMLKTLGSNGSIDIDEFDNQEVYTVATDSDDWAESNQVRYEKKDLIADLNTFVGEVKRSVKPWSYKLALLTYITHDSDTTLTFDDVGIKAKDEYTLRLYLTKSISALNLKFALTGNWLVNVALYDKLKTVLETGSWATSYATNKTDNYKSYGPYKLTYFEAGKEIKIGRNDKWYGYTDGKHTGQFQMEEIDTRIIKEHTTAINEFMAGRLDDIDLTVDDMTTYGSSGRRSTTYESYTQKISFNTDYAKLKSRQTGTNNKTVISNKNFREGLSLSLDRNDFAAKATAGSKGFTGLLNDLYLANVATGVSYRSTKQGKSVYNMVYGNLGGETIGSGTALSESACGYNSTLAALYVAQGLKEELASTSEGHLAAGNTIEIEFRVYDNESETTKKMYTSINGAWTKIIDAANKLLIADNVLTEKTKIGFNLTMVKDEDYYTTASNGGYDMIFSTWGGATVDPWGLMQVYLDKTFASTCEYGFKGKQGQVDLSIDVDGNGTIGDDETKSFSDWYTYMTSTLSEGKFADDIKEGDADYAEWHAIHEKRLNVLAGTEAGIISRFETIPMVARGTSSLQGFKCENATKTYVSLVGYGGIRFMTFNYTNSEWSTFVNKYNNNLGNLYATYTDDAE